MSKCIRILAIAFIFGFSVRYSTALKCWVCNDKSTLRECHAQYGAMQNCPNKDDVCQNDFRTASGRAIITKGCKQRAACRNEVRQNRDKNQCGRKTRNMVCRCCCARNGCNAKESGCIPPPPPCKPLPRPLNGFVLDCPRTITFGSRCRIRCKQGYRLIGPERPTCVRIQPGSRTGKWNIRNPIRCQKVVIRCDPPRTAPPNGLVTCENSKEYQKRLDFNFDGSVCSYSCKKNYFLNGKMRTKCNNAKQWSNTPPTCVKGQCEAPKNDPNRVSTCTDRNYFGSECKFSCKKGFNLIGATESTCKQVGTSSSGFWTKSLATCAKVLCYPKLTQPANGKVTCSDANVKGSVCDYSCNKGYDLDGTNRPTSSAACRDDNDGDAIGEWSIPPATCSRIKCEPSFRDPNGGQVACSDGKFYGSKCTFSCNSDFDLAGTRDSALVSTCEDDGNGDAIGKWSEQAADCKSIACEPEFIQERTEDISCTKGNAPDSVCTLSCKTDFVLEGTITRYETSRCIPPKDGTAKGRWTRVDKPKCIPIRCPRLSLIENGVMICSLFNLRGSFCVFYCDDGYDRIGASYMMCKKGKVEGSPDGEWTDKQPTCRLGQCAFPQFDKNAVVENCVPAEGYPANEYRVGTKCTYTCKSDAYYMAPNIGTEPILSRVVTSECDINKHWTNLVPRCLIKKCLPQLPPPRFGYTPECTRGNEFGSKCTFSCQEKHSPSHDLPLVCQHDGDNDEYGRWSAEAPKCERSHCDDYGTVLHGRLNCTDGTRIGSVCQLQCIDHYTIKNYETTECMPSATWSRRKYFCCVRCLFNNRLKIVTAIDRSTIRNDADWKLMIAFTRSYLTLMLQSRLQVSFAAFTYADDVDLDTEISMRRLRNMKDIRIVTEGLQSMRTGGRLSSTGEALQYINEAIYERWDRRREHFVILITEGRSTDEYLEISKTIRKRGIDILATGLNVNPAGRSQLLEITGAADNVFTTTRVSDMLLIPEKIFEISRTTGCTLASKSQSCP